MLLPSNMPHVYPPLEWLDASNSIFTIPCLDVRGLTKYWKAMPADQGVVETFHKFREADGSKLPAVGKDWPGNLLMCDMRYPSFPKSTTIPLCRARVMEEKWDIFYCEDYYVYFCRSWTGQPIFRATVEELEGFSLITGIEINPEKGYPTDQARMCVDFLVKSHIFGLDVPVYTPEWVVKQSKMAAIVPMDDGIEDIRNLLDPVKIAEYVFHEYGNKASFAAFQDPSSIPIFYDWSVFLDGKSFLGIHNLKPHIAISDKNIECPVQGCDKYVPRQRGRFVREEKFQCPIHKIYISPSTFEYPKWIDNLLWTAPEDLVLLNGILSVKRENRIARSNSEDALTWNVFRYLEKSGILEEILSRIIGRNLQNTKSFFWTYDAQSHTAWQDLKTYSEIFGEKPGFGTEPDLIIRTEEMLCFIEVKLGSSHDTTPSNANVGTIYTSAVNGWYQKVFKADFKTVALLQKRYELLRQWLIGSRMADRSDRKFLLLTVNPQTQSAQAIQPFSSLIQQNEERQFSCLSWEDIYQFVSRFGPPTRDTLLLLTYLNNKTLSYDKNGCLQKAFNLT